MVIILGGIVSGIFTATESASVAVIYSILLTFFFYRTMTWDRFMHAAAKACKTTGVVLLLIGVSTMFQYLMGLYSVADLAGEAMANISTNPWVIFFLINLILFILGTFMDMASTILICTPIFLPIAMAHGMSPVQFGMVMLINCALGLNTPPVGTTQFIGCAIGGISVGEVMKSILPFYTRPDRRVDARHLRAGVQPDPAQPVHALRKRPMPKVALSGASGNIGQVLRPALLERGVDLRSAGGRRPLTPLRPGEDVMHGDLTDPAVVDRLLQGVDVLIHMAGTSVERPLPEIIQNNLVGLHRFTRVRAGMASSGWCSPAPTTRSACIRSTRSSSSTARSGPTASTASARFGARR